MEKVRNSGSRQRPIFCLSDLSQRFVILRSAGSVLSSCCVVLTLSALPVSCKKEPAPEPVVEEPAPVQVDSVRTTLRLRAQGAPERLDLFIYDAQGTQALERHLQLDSVPEELQVTTTEGEKILVGIADSPRRFNLAALGRFDAMQKLAFSFRDDSPEQSVQGGWCTTEGQAGKLELQPLLCRIVLASVCNTMDGYVLLEDPRIRLRDLPAAAEILREQEFRPAELLDAGAWTSLPCDVGYFPQEPGIPLWCYPNDTPEEILGVPRPSLDFECRIDGELYTFEVPMPPLPRGCTKEVELVVDGPYNHHYKVR